MKKLLSSLIVGSVLFFSGCGDNKVTLNQAITKGNLVVQNGMTKQQVMNIMKIEPSTIERVGNIELWIYEGVVTNPDTEQQRYKNFTIRFKDGKVDYAGYFGCQLPKVEE